MSLILDYAVKISQVTSLPAPSFNFLHTLAVVVPFQANPASAVITVPAGTVEIPAVITLDGVFQDGAILDGIFFSDVQPTGFHATLTINGGATAEDAAILWADLIKGIDQLTAVANGNTIEVRAGGGGVDVSITDVLLDETGASGYAIIEVNDVLDLPEYTDQWNEIGGAFDGGLSSVTLVMVETAADLPVALVDQESNFYTLACSSAIPADEFFDNTDTWQAVSGLVHNVQIEAEVFAIREKTCAFMYDNPTTNAYNMLLAFGSLLSAAAWRNQQYIPSTKSVGSIIALGAAESLFADRISFFMSDNESGNRLGFFVAGGKSITTPYIDKQFLLEVQFEQTNHLTVNQPFNVAVERSELERIGDNLIEEYLEAGYFDPDGVNDMVITEGVEVFTVNGNVTTSPSIALWRVFLDAFQTQG
jgi:hypothetical protein